MSEKKVETVLVGFNFTNDEKNPIMLVGRKEPNGQATIINTMQGPEVLELYKKLIGEKTN